MSSTQAIKFYDHHPGVANLREEVLRGLALRPKKIPPKFFYDKRGSELFDAICELAEYYLTRTEILLLQSHAREIADLTGSGCLLIELGSGASKKVRLLLEALQPSAYMGIDISKDFLLESARRLAADYPWLAVHAACADFTQTLNLSYCPAHLNKLAFFPGSTIGNFEPKEAVSFLKRLSGILGRGGGLLVGVDLKKVPALLHSAYNDGKGVTAAFNLNLLRRIHDELDTDLDPNSFYHRAVYNKTKGRIEMYLLSHYAQWVRIEDRRFHFAVGEGLHTENSYKYTIAEFQQFARRAGYQVERVWTDTKQLFSLHYLRVRDRSP
jgi:dimethylhistidine N-methyltransferase